MPAYAFSSKRVRILVFRTEVFSFFLVNYNGSGCLVTLMLLLLFRGFNYCLIKLTVLAVGRSWPKASNY